MKNSASFYRLEAMRYLNGKYQKPIIVVLVFGVATAVYQWLTRLICGTQEVVYMGITTTTTANPTLNSLMNLIWLFVSGAIAFAYIYMTIKIVKEEELDVQDVVLSGFKNDFWKNAFTYILVGIFTFLWALLLIIPGIIKNYSYSMAMYLRNKEENISAGDAIDKSKQLMDGNKMNLFILDLTYLGWYFIGVFTLGILWLWVVPRHYTARTIAFNEIYGVEDKEEAEDVEAEIVE